MGRLSRPYDLSAALGWGFFAGIWGSGKCQFQNGRAADIPSFKAFTFCNHQLVNRRRRILMLVGCGLVVRLVAAMFSSRRRDSVPDSVISGLHDGLIRDGFNLDQKVTSID